MQPAIKNDLVYLLQILEASGKALLYTAGFKNANEFFAGNEQMNFDACLLMLRNIGEQSGKISPELKLKYTTIDWNKIKGLRNKVVHDYTGVDREIIFEIITKFLPPLKSNIHFIVNSELKVGNFQKEEFDVARMSNFYKHVDFDSIVKA